MLTPAQILRNWRQQQQPSNQGDIDSSVTKKLGESIMRGAWGVYGFISAP
jgi:hypothetical protein